MSLEIAMICRAAREELSAGAVRGRYCGKCGEEVQVSRAGQERLRQTPETKILCNRCGFALAEQAEAKGALAGVVLHPAAIEQLRKRKP